MAHDQMTVMLKPHLWANHGFYTGDLDFSSDEWKKWESNYEKYILDFAQLAQNENIELFCFGTELGNAVAKDQNTINSKNKKNLLRKLTQQTGMILIKYRFGMS
jgi:hypothetical protein